jgi:hypothetical protein
VILSPAVTLLSEMDGFTPKQSASLSVSANSLDLITNS